MLYLSLIINILLFILIIVVLLKGRSNDSNVAISEKLSILENIEREVKSLSSTFTIPYQRGEAGETLLKELIKNYLPEKSYSFQYPFKSGQKVDAVIKTGKYIIPVDSKFPMQSVSEVNNQSKRVFLKYAADISEKYINPSEGTLNFAIMYIPSEKHYYSFFVEGNGELTNQLLKLGILPASPSSLFSLFQTVVYGLKGFTFNQKQNEILEKIEELKLNYNRLRKQYSLSNTHLKNLNMALNGFEKLIDDGENKIVD